MDINIAAYVFLVKDYFSSGGPFLSWPISKSQTPTNN